MQGSFGLVGAPAFELKLVELLAYAISYFGKASRAALARAVGPL